MKNGSNQQNLHSLAEAHIYVSILKADSKITVKELVEAFFHARKSQKLMNILNVNDGIGELVVRYIKLIVKDSKYGDWDCHMHLDYAIGLLSDLKNTGDWSVKLLYDKIENGMRNLILIDGYDMKESEFIENVFSKLKMLKNTVTAQ